MRATTFTTYINTELDPGYIRAYDKMADVAVARFATIESAADAAARATAGILGGTGTAGRGAAQTRELTQLADAERSVGQRAVEAQRAVTNSAATIRNQGRDARAATLQNSGLAKSLQATATALNIVQGPLGPLAGRIGAISKAVSELTGFRLGLAGLGSALFAIGRAGNEYTVLQSRLTPFFQTQQRANQAMEEAVGIAKRTRAPLSAVVDLYGRLAAVGNDVGISTGRAARIAEIAAKAATLSGGTTQTREAGLNQFLQGIGSNTLAGDELRSVKENTFALAQAIAQGFKNADGSIGTTIGHLKDLGAQGQLTASAVADALERSASRIDSAYAKLPLSLGQAGTEFTNSLTVMVGRLDDSVKFTSTLAQSIQIVAEHLRAVTALALGFGAVWAAPRLLSAGKSIATGIDAVIQRTIVARQTVREMDAAWLEDLTASRAAAAARVEELEAERVAIRRNILELQRKADFSRSVINKPVSNVNQITWGRDPDTGFLVSSTRATRDLERATLALSERQSHLTEINRELRAAYGVSEQAGIRLATATENVGRRMGLLRTVAGGLVDFLGGPWGIAFGIATTALYLLATAQSEAEKATARNEKAQRDFEAQVDRTTGKIFDQIGALQKLSLSTEQGGALTSANQQVDQRRTDLLREVLKFTRGTLYSQEIPTRYSYQYGASGAPRLVAQRDPRSAEQRELAGLARDVYDRKPGSLPALEAGLKRLAPAIQGLAADLPALGNLARDLRVSVQGGTDSQGKQVNGSRQAAARSRIASGRARAGDTEIAFGTDNGLTANGSGRPSSRSQLNASALAKAAQTDLQRARAEEAEIRAKGKQANETEDQYTDRLAAAITKVRQLEQAEKDAAKAQRTANAQARRDAHDAKQDQLDAAKRKRDAALLDLENQHLNPNSDAFIQKRLEILKSYDDEVNAIDRSRAASNSAATQMIADAERVAKAAATAGEKRNDILGQYSDQPRPVARAFDQIDDLQKFVDTAVDGAAFIGKTRDEIEQIKKINPLGTGIYTQAMADADARHIIQGVQKPLDDVLRDHERDLEVNRLILQGREAEAEALRTAYGLYDSIGTLNQGAYERLVRDVEENQKINDLLESRQRIVSAYSGILDTARDSLATFITDASTEGPKAAGNLIKSLLAQITRVQATQITETLFAGADAKVRALLSGRSSVDQAIYQFNGSIGQAQSATARLGSELTRLADTVNDVRKEFAANDNGPAALVGGNSRSIVNAALNTGSGLSAVGKGIVSALRVAAPTSADATADTILVNGIRQPRRAPAITSGQPNLGDITKSVISTPFEKLDHLWDKVVSGKTRQADGTVINRDGSLATGSTFFKKMGDTFGGALKGAGTGAIASGFAQALGIKQNSAGAQIGGALGSLIPGAGPLGSILGGLIGGSLLGGLLAPKTWGSSSVSLNQWGEAVAGPGTGHGEGHTAAAVGAAGSVAQGINQIMSALGGTISNLPGITIGNFDDKARVALTSTSQALNYKNFDSSVLKDFGKGGEQDAIAYAIRYSLEKGVITGISQASINILKSGQDLQQALDKATAIESIPKQLLQLTDPARYAVTELNDQFTKLISYLKEGGATAEQFADAQKLYDLQREEAIKQAQQQAAGAINDFLNEMTGGQSSPLNKRTVYQNALDQLNGFKADIAAGKVVDQNDLLAAARNFEDASRNLFGSSQSFFDDFNALRDLLEQARDNAGNTDVSTLPASPFAGDSTVQDKLAELGQSQLQATNDQTTTLGAKLDTLTRAVESLSSGGTSARAADATNLLPGFGNSLAS